MPSAQATGSGQLKLFWGKFRAAGEPPPAKPGLWPALVTALFISFVLLTLPSAAPDLGIDSGWSAVLNWAHQRGLQFGQEIVFTYGPLGFLVAPYYFGQSELQLVGANLLLCFLVALGLCLVAWRLGLLWRWVLLVIFVFESSNVQARVDLMFETGFLCWGLLCFIESGRTRRSSAVAWMVLIIFAALAKVTYLFVGTFSVCVLSAHLLLGGEKRAGLALLPSFAGALALAWVASGQAIANVGAFLFRGLLISRGYDQAAGLEGLPMLRTQAWLLGGAALVAMVLYTAAAGSSVERAARWRMACVVGWVLGLFFVVWKHSMVRVDRYHVIELAVFAPAVAIAFETLPDKHPRLRWGARGLALVCCLLSFQLLKSTFLPDLLSAIQQPFQQFEYHLRAVLQPADWKRGFEPALNELRNQAQLPELRRIVGNSSVDVFGSLQAYALLNDLNYRPRPVFQSYAAHSTSLARLNENFYLSAKGPDYVLFELSAPEHRFPALNDGPTLLALLINYRVAASEGPFLLLKRAGNEKERLTLVKEGELPAGGAFELGPYAGANLWLELEVEPNLRGRLIGWLTRLPVLRLASWNGSKLIARERAAVPLLRTGFVASPRLLNTADVREFYQGNRVTRPSAYSVELSPGEERFWKPEVRFRMYKIENQLGH